MARRKVRRFNDGQLTYGPWYIGDWISSATVLGLSDAGYRLWHLVCLRVMERGSVPDDPAAVRAVCPGVRDFEAAWAEVRPLLQVDEDGRLYQGRARSEYRHGVEVCTEAHRAGQRGGRPPAGTDRFTDRGSDAVTDRYTDRVTDRVTHPDPDPERTLDSTEDSCSRRGGHGGAAPPPVGAEGADASTGAARGASNGHRPSAPTRPSRGQLAGRGVQPPRDPGADPDPPETAPVGTSRAVPAVEPGGRPTAPAEPAGPQTAAQAARRDPPRAAPEDVARVCAAVRRLVQVRHGEAGGKARRAARNELSAAWTKAADLLLRRGPPGDDAPVPGPEAVEVCRWLAQDAPTSRDGFCWGEVIETPAKLRERWVDVVAARERATRVVPGAGTVGSAAWRRLVERLTSGEKYARSMFDERTLRAADAVGGLGRVYEVAKTGSTFDQRDARRDFVLAYEGATTE